MKKSIFVIILMSILFSTCKKEEPVPDCEAQNYGELSITNLNNYSYELFVNSTSFGKINAKGTKVIKFTPGSCTIKFVDDDGYWFSTVDLKQCDFKKLNFKF